MTTTLTRMLVYATGKSVNRAVQFVFAISILALPGCLSLGSSDSHKAASATDREVAEMAKLYRLCLQKNEETPEKAKANCALYKEAIHDLAPAQKKSIMAEVLGQLAD
jgi:hypothetical protein